MNLLNNTSGYWQLNNNKYNNCNDRMFFMTKNGITNQEREKFVSRLALHKKIIKEITDLGFASHTMKHLESLMFSLGSKNFHST